MQEYYIIDFCKWNHLTILNYVCAIQVSGIFYQCLKNENIFFERKTINFKLYNNYNMHEYYITFFFTCKCLYNYLIFEKYLVFQYFQTMLKIEIIDISNVIDISN